MTAKRKKSNEREATNDWLSTTISFITHRRQNLYSLRQGEYFFSQRFEWFCRGLIFSFSFARNIEKIKMRLSTVIFLFMALCTFVNLPPIAHEEKNGSKMAGNRFNALSELWNGENADKMGEQRST